MTTIADRSSIATQAEPIRLIALHHVHRSHFDTGIPAAALCGLTQRWTKRHGSSGRKVYTVVCPTCSEALAALR